MKLFEGSSVSVKMKKILFLSLILPIFFSGCDNGSLSSKSKTKLIKTDCIEPNNPYNDGGGHDAGFNWARENGGDCNGQSDSFNEGCAEFSRQLNEYNECVANSK